MVLIPLFFSHLTVKTQGLSSLRKIERIQGYPHYARNIEKPIFFLV